MQQFDKEDWDNWAIQPITKEFIKLLERRVITEQTERNFTSSGDQLTREYYQSQGICEGYGLVIDQIRYCELIK